jgi:hypothetical protein
MLWIKLDVHEGEFKVLVFVDDQVGCGVQSCAKVGRSRGWRSRSWGETRGTHFCGARIRRCSQNITVLSSPVDVLNSRSTQGLTGVRRVNFGVFGQMFLVAET